MHRGVYTAAAGMQAADKWLDTISANLANSSTVGFKRESIDFNEQLLRELHNASGRALGELGAGPGAVERHVIFDVGTPLSTGNPMDVSIRTREGLFAVDTPEGVRYTRNGSFGISSDGYLSSREGHHVLDAQGQPIQLPPGITEITPSGQVQVNGQPVGQLALFDGDFKRYGNSLFTCENASLMTNVNLATSAVESSNVNAIEEMVSMIKLNRAFELSQKSVTTQDEASEKLLQILGG